MQLFYLEDTPDDEFNLSAEESRHLIRVLRRQVGDRVSFTDGKGREYIGEITSNNHHQAGIRLIAQKLHPEKLPRLHLAIAPTKKAEKIEWCLEKCIEIGLASFTPLITRRTERNRLKAERLEKIALSAMKQSNQFYLPSIHESTRLEDILNASESYHHRFIAHCEDEEKHYLPQKNISGDTMILIGPEGDFTSEEIQLALDSGFDPISLGESRLRTETAGIFACAAFRIISEKL